MAPRSQRLRALARRLKKFEDFGESGVNHFPRDPNKTTDENMSVPADHYPGLITKTLGGPALTQHRPHQYEGPRGIASAEDEDGDEEDEDDS